MNIRQANEALSSSSTSVRRRTWRLAVTQVLIGLVVPILLAGCLSFAQQTDRPSLASDLVFDQSGGFAGVDNELSISAAGRLVRKGGLTGQVNRNLFANEMDQLRALLDGWDAINFNAPPNGCADVFSHSITYAGRTASWDDCTESVPPQLLALEEFLLRL